jgi:hypothetical protein
MAFKHQDNSGSLFKNSYKTEPKHPDHQGSCKIVCPYCNKPQEFKISAWINDLKDKTGKYFGLNFSINVPKEQNTPVDYDPDDDIPF